MIRNIICKACYIKSSALHPEDAAMGYKQRFVVGQARKPEKHEIIFKSGSSLDDLKTEQVIPLASLVCDFCNEPLPDGTEVIAKTMWRESGTPPEWESEFLTQAEFISQNQ